jgi:hypothetical protein
MGLRGHKNQYFKNLVGEHNVPAADSRDAPFVHNFNFLRKQSWNFHYMHVFLLQSVLPVPLQLRQHNRLLRLPGCR